MMNLFDRIANLVQSFRDLSFDNWAVSSQNFLRSLADLIGFAGDLISPKKFGNAADAGSGGSVLDCSSMTDQELCDQLVFHANQHEAFFASPAIPNVTSVSPMLISLLLEFVRRGLDKLFK